MVNTNQIAHIGLVVGEPARAAMLVALMDGRALTAGELARAAGITPQTASSHLARLTDAALLTAEKQGRHRYHRLASPEIARMLEGIMQIASRAGAPARRIAAGPRDAALRKARTCYDHLAGRLGVAISDALIDRGAIEFGDEAGLLSESGVAFLADIGVDLSATTRGRRLTARAFCRPCLDWSERRPHLAGRVGAAICSHFFQQRYVRRTDGSRALTVTRKGEQALRDLFGIRAL